MQYLQLSQEDRFNLEGITLLKVMEYNFEEIYAYVLHWWLIQFEQLYTLGI